MNFYEQVYALVTRVPAGHVVSYVQIALALGVPHGARVVGWAMKHCPGDLPWHRVINAGGRISAPVHSERYTEQMTRLSDEGVDQDLFGKYDFKRYGWNGL